MHRAAALLLFLAAPAAAQDAPLELPAAAEEEAREPEAPIALDSPDAEIAERLRGIFGTLEGLENVQVQVRSGIVRLSGTTLTGEQRQRAAEIAERLSGVVEVDNQIAAETRLDRRLSPVLRDARERGWQLVAYAPLLLVALLAFLLFWWAGRLITRATSPFRRVAPNRFIEELLEQILRFAFTLAGLVIAMAILGATALLTSVLGAAGVVGLAIGFAVRDTIENYIASILLSIRQPFAPGDHVVIEGFEGRVARLNSRATVLMTFDGNEVRIPNATVYKSIITNFTRMPDRRFEFEIGIGGEEEIATALALAQRTLRAVTGVLVRPEPMAIVDRLGDWATMLKLYGWADQAQSDFLKVRSEAIRRVKEAFDREGITMPEPINQLRISPAGGKSGAGGASPHPPGAEELARATDVSPDETIVEKVAVVRNSGEPDLLDRQAPRE